MVKFVSLFVYLIVVLEVLAEVKTCHSWTSLLECISVTLWGASLPKPTMEGLWFGCFFQRFFGDDHDPFHWLVYHDFLSNCPIYFHWFACNFVAYFHGISMVFPMVLRHSPISFETSHPPIIAPFLTEDHPLRRKTQSFGQVVQR